MRSIEQSYSGGNTRDRSKNSKKVYRSLWLLEGTEVETYATGYLFHDERHTSSRYPRLSFPQRTHAKKWKKISCRFCLFHPKNAELYVPLSKTGVLVFLRRNGVYAYLPKTGIYVHPGYIQLRGLGVCAPERLSCMYTEED